MFRRIMSRRVVSVNYRYVDQNVTIFNAYRKFSDLHIAIEMVYAGAAIVPSAVPRTHEEVALQDALPERPFAAGADSIERVNLAVQIAECEFVSADRYFGRRTRRKRGERQDFDEHWHLPCSSRL
jgi:hypothetical protein